MRVFHFLKSLFAGNQRKWNKFKQKSYEEASAHKIQPFNTSNKNVLEAIRQQMMPPLQKQNPSHSTFPEPPTKNSMAGSLVKPKRIVAGWK